VGQNVVIFLLFKKIFDYIALSHKYNIYLTTHLFFKLDFGVRIVFKMFLFFFQDLGAILGFAFLFILPVTSTLIEPAEMLESAEGDGDHFSKCGRKDGEMFPSRARSKTITLLL
jgi:hypothetical protein